MKSLGRNELYPMIYAPKCNLKGFDFHKLKIMLFAVFQKTTNNVAYFFETLGFQQKILPDV